EEIRDIENKYKSVYKNFRFELYGAKELSNYIDLQNDKTINMDFNIIYDINSPSIIENEYNNIKSLVCNIKANDLIKIFKLQKSEYLFEQNVRKYLEDRSKVNKNIIDSASSTDSQYFSALNNGVTMICDNYNLRRAGGSAILKMKNLQIINGCQTSMALYEADKNGTLKDDTMLLLRVHQTNDNEIIEKIILATNNQNPINPRDLVSNTTEQIDLQKYFFDIYGVVYQRKRNDFMDLNGNKVNKKDVVSNDKVGQAALACIKCSPHIALSAKGRVFTKDIDIFSKNKEKIALAFFIHEKVLEYSKNDKIKSNSEMVSIMKFGRFHITYLLYKKYSKDVSIELNKKIKCNDINLEQDMLLAICRLNNNLSEERKMNLLAYFKSKDSVNEIEEVLINR
ncbi:AIPR family protein, partial [Clostridium novyi]|uniref:AIPR family protein n=1 Tax=Clostridium novyi TaxID=1542 RepID=UPI0004D42A76